MKTYVLTVSRYFPTTHKRKGEPTFFVEKIFQGKSKIIPCFQCFRNDICDGNCLINSMNFQPKIHTIRSNYELWAKRIKEVQEGKAILSIRYWSGKPYNSKQVEVCQLTKDSGCGVQKIMIDGIYQYKIDNGDKRWGMEELSKNDGLSVADFKEWFKNYDLNPMAIIHFTSFRY